MNKKRSYKNLIYGLFLSLLSVPIWASADFPDPISDTIDPPPTSPIDNYIVLAVFLTVTFVGYYFYKSNKISLNNEK